LTYFEFATLAALLCFKEQKLDVVILEVGIGGRLDATNIIDADLSIITGIDFDHQDYLGSTLEAIGFEKAGILRQGKLFIYADDNPPLNIIKAAQDLAVNSFFYGKEFSINEKCDSFEINFLGQPRCTLPKPKIQLKSASAAVVASFLLQNKLPVDPESLAIAMRDLFIPGRLQLIKGPVWTLYDVAHNAQSARLLADTIKTLNIKGRVHAIFSALKDKDIFGLINPLRDCVDLWYPAQLENKRALSAESLLSLFKEAQILAEYCYNSPVIAYKTALNQANIGDLIVIYGSFITVSQVIASQ
jgi:dihydrofolate synthase/folylpolyglutamate synthase